MKRVLILGAGLVTGPIVSYLLDKGYRVTVASRTVGLPFSISKTAVFPMPARSASAC